MKKVLISVIATLLVLVCLAQTGLLEIFGIHGISFYSKKKEKEENASGSGFEEYTESQTGVSYRFKTKGDYFYVYEDSEWKQLFMCGVNIGATEPGLFPGDLTISYETYYRWFGYISEMNCNCIRIYTLMPPQFYQALNDFNNSADNKLYLFQGIWVNEEDIERLSDAYAENEKILNDFTADAVNLVNVIHGNAKIAESAGEAFGTYTADVSKWLAGWIVGIEWDPNFVMNTDNQHPDKKDYDGEYLYTQTASPFEAFLCRVGDAMIKYETENYKFQSPFAFTNWITTDPLTHPNEPHEDEDKATVNTENVKCRNFGPGMFASYHIYPYYPDSLNYQEDYLEYVDEEGNVNTYTAYLEDLKLAHTIPIIVAEFGVPTSRGMGHESVMGYNQGMVDETDQGEMLINMFECIKEAKYAGGIVFTWQDEWFKRTWNNVMFDIADRRPFWSNIQTTEQCFGVLAFDPGADSMACYVDGDISEWKSASPLVTTEQGKLYVKSDERYLYLMLDMEDYDFENETLLIPVNTIADQGNTKSSQFNAEFDEGADFLICINGKDNSHIYVDKYYDAFNYYFLESKKLSDIKAEENANEKDSGVFDIMRLCYGYNLTVKGTGETVPDKAYETGKLRYGNGNPGSKNYKSLSDYCYGDGKLEIRIPWQLLNVMDPSGKQQISDFWQTQVISPQSFEGFDIGFAYKSDGSETVSVSLSGSYEYSGWNTPSWHERLKPAYYELQDYLAQYKESESK
ncbi:MAG: family 2 glycosyl transferase [Clostridia bacterium]|nr:family 2 glycosyl transferase [Clostridia bacterium]